MSAIDEGIVREYFEQNGFFTRQVRKYQVQSRKKNSDEEIDLLVYNPAWRSDRHPDFFLFAGELPYIQRAVVSVRAWHTGVFTPTMLRSSPEIFRFLEETVIRDAERLFPPADLQKGKGEDLIKILVLPGLPTLEPFKTQSVELLKERGVDGIISFRTMLLDLISKVEVNLNYRKSDMLQMLRILKNYDLLKPAQMDFLGAAGSSMGGRRRV